jgi:hypothetical protein
MYKHELYQHAVEDDLAWLEAVKDKKHLVFWDRDMTLPNAPRGPFGKDCMQPVAQAHATGDWTDEAAGRPAEGIRYEKGSAGVDGDVVMLHHAFHWAGWIRNYKSPFNDNEGMWPFRWPVVHYGYARPMYKKRWKEKVWQSASPWARNNLRVDKLHVSDEAPFLRDYTDHPTALIETVDRVSDIIESSKG